MCYSCEWRKPFENWYCVNYFVQYFQIKNYYWYKIINKVAFFFLFASIYFVFQEVCNNMESVFKELLTRQMQQDAAQAQQKKGKRDGRKGKGTSLFRSTDQLDWVDQHQHMTATEMMLMKTEGQSEGVWQQLSAHLFLETRSQWPLTPAPRHPWLGILCHHFSFLHPLEWLQTRSNL